MSLRLGFLHQRGCNLARTHIAHGSNAHYSAGEGEGKTRSRKSVWQARCTSSHAPVKDEDYQRSTLVGTTNSTPPIGQIARQKQADKEFFASLLSSAATKRDAKAYISRLKEPTKTAPRPTTSRPPRPQVNLGGLFPPVRAVGQSPVFTQYEPEQEDFKDEEILHVALVKLSDLDQLSDSVVVGIAETLCQLARLSMAPCVVLGSSHDADTGYRYELKMQADRLSTAIEGITGGGARIIESIFSMSHSNELGVPLRKLLTVPLRRGLIPVILPSAYSETEQKITSISANDALLALIKDYTDLKSVHGRPTRSPAIKPVSIDRLIVIDQAGGIPNQGSADGNHVFLNLEQEYTTVLQQLTSMKDAHSQSHLETLHMFRQAMEWLPPSASGLMATPEEAANMSEMMYDSGLTSVGTRRQKNALIHNILTDKPVYSSSLPKSRLSRVVGAASPPPAATFVKHGMPLTIIPDPATQPWTAAGPRIRLTDSEIDLERLVHLVDDSFDRELDVENYLKRVNDRIAGVIIAGDYEGGAILTWETPPGVSNADTERLVPYLDKFAVLKKAQGAGGVADIVFNAMVRTCFPEGVCWRSRKNNPVNKWYFERSRGTTKISDMNWTMFWTTPEVAVDSQKLRDYQGVCRSVEPTWLDKKMAAD